MTKEVLNLETSEVFLAFGKKSHFVNKALLLTQDNITLLVHLSVLHFASKRGMQGALGDSLLPLRDDAALASHTKASSQVAWNDPRWPSCRHESLFAATHAYVLILSPVIICTNRGIELPILRIPVLICYIRIPCAINTLTEGIVGCHQFCCDVLGGCGAATHTLGHDNGTRMLASALFGLGA